MLKLLFCLLVSVYFVYAKHEEFEGYSLYEVKVNSIDQIQDVNAIAQNVNADIWSYALPGREGLFMVAKEMKQLFENNLRAINVEYKIESSNIKEILDIEDKILGEASKKSNATDQSRFIGSLIIPRYDAVNRHIEDIANRFPNVARVVTGGKSVEGREIKYLRISTTNFQDRTKPVIFMQSLLHAREWITLPVTLYAIEKLVVDVTERDLVDNIDWIILPIANPDGYEYSHTNNRIWRKNRATGYGLCPGVDLNRNFDAMWGTASSSISCTDTFHGPSPFSEPETQVTRNIFNEHGSRIKLFLDIHSFGSMILFGYGNRTLPPNALILNMVGVQMAQSIDSVKLSHNPNYRVGNIVDVIRYYASGSASDYAQLEMGQGLAYTFELPGPRISIGVLGFLVDPGFIPQASFETWEGIKIGARYLTRN